MNDQLAFAVITPYTIQKSRTGAVIARLLGRCESELIAAHMFAPSRELAEAYAETIRVVDDPEDERLRGLIRNYIRTNLTPDSSGLRRRVLMLVFRGENADEDLRQVAGHLGISCTSGETIRDTYGDLVYSRDGSVKYFEPALLTSDGPDTVLQDLELWLDFAEHESPLLENICVYQDPSRVQRTLVIIKPDSWRRRSLRPGAIIDMFSRTGLRIIGCRLCRISVEQALEFYGPVQQALEKRLGPGIAKKARHVLEHEFGLKLADSIEASLAESVGVPYARHQFERIVEFMTGLDPEGCDAVRRSEPGAAKTLALVYEGEDAVAKIRDVLGPTDPTRAPTGTVRREFGSDVMVNTAHASDSPENAEREMRILRMRDSGFIETVRNCM
ncbi:MAG: nucleoside-diphosphate kinase [Lentisphaerae bacterium]|jgi:nucleoside diphosphate kinase|nr:nucleoside-diphosphate kinase [Lentisphaerota bacterium]MBT4817479.1 nucleoside-diphosphate kinase [Lentisphaerota bacterium]MBT5612738.1 nucleoside-diphosphate kinase [Lentisphaerota bacterium]MBT7058967.1 nucleoside-diphosphate kinase [Lentisphaerota bacterium]MBT7848387.1 nucleoside-diphosphate kinase [Lentisphaerota bacterium]